jgi:predicted Zn finger-like uncharacterized protein
MIVPCDCGANLRLDDGKVGDKGVRVRCPRCGTVLHARRPEQTPEMPPPLPPVRLQASPVPAQQPPTAPGITVLIALENEGARAMIRDILFEHGFGVEEAADGLVALKKVADLRPQVVIVDVGLPGIYGFELCERIKEHQKESAPKIILLASTYDIHRYKRGPVSLYGADDYIEKHQIADLLVLKIRRLLYGEPAGEPSEHEGVAPAAETPTLQPAMKRSEDAFEFSPETLLRDDIEEPVTAPAGPGGAAGPEPAPSSWLDTFIKQSQDGPAMSPDSFSVESSVLHGGDAVLSPVAEGDPEAVGKAKRLARIIVSDVALYNQDTVREGILNGTFYDLLRDDIEEGRQLYEKRVPSPIREMRDYYQEAFDSFIEAQKKIVR